MTENPGKVYRFRRETTAQLGTCKKCICLESHACEQVPRSQTDAHRQTSPWHRGKPSPVLEHRQRLRSLGRVVLVLWVTVGHSRDVRCPQAQAGIPSRGGKGRGRALP